MSLVITKENFESEVLKSDKPVLVDFWAAFNVDEQPELASQFAVMSIPTLIVFKNGEIANKAIGVQPKDAILSML